MNETNDGRRPGRVVHETNDDHKAKHLLRVFCCCVHLLTLLLCCVAVVVCIVLFVNHHHHHPALPCRRLTSCTLPKPRFVPLAH
jgi:hypothetical protein